MNFNGENGKFWCHSKAESLAFKMRPNLLFEYQEVEGKDAGKRVFDYLALRHQK